jgi:hypothetical protein
VTEDGIYEAVLLSNLGCELARGRAQVTKSFIIPPVLEQSYTICAAEKVLVTLDPGTYGFYSWVLGEEEVATSPTFIPTLPGNYTLTVGDETGCVFSIEFEVLEDCNLAIIFPNAIRPSDPSRHFTVFVNDFVDEVEVMIYNRWGELIHYCQTTEINGELNFCPWDGTVRGTVVPIGSYPVVVRYTSNQQNVTKTLTRAIVVIE